MTIETFPPEAPLNCERCPRLASFLEEQRALKPDWFNAPVPSFGDADSRLLVIGLAPGLSGANRTGRPFTGDGAGDFLYPALESAGFSRGSYDKRPDDGLTLVDAMITNAVRCVPPQNKPTGAEINTCRPYLLSRIESFPNLKVMLALGKIAHDSTIRGLGLRLKDHKFGHATEYEVRPGLTLLSSYHCSRYNVNTRRLTWEMFEGVFKRAREICDA
jgi:uracil-DNA glycosylase family 4